MKTLLLLLTLTACAAATERGATSRLPYPSRNGRVPAERLAAARYVLPGTLTHVRRNWIYEPTCGLFTKVRGQLHLGEGCNGMQAYEADIVADTTLVAARKVHIIYFVMSDSAGLAPGTSAVWILHRDAVYPVLTCAQHQAITSTGCLAEMWPTLESDDDVIALSEWPEVRDALHELRRDR